MIRLISRSKMLGIGLASVFLVAAACGGSGDSDNGSPSAATATSRPASSSNVAADTAVVKVGEREYTFAMAGALGRQCRSLFGVLVGGGQSADGSDISLTIQIPPENWESRPDDFSAPEIRINDDVNDEDWRAGVDGLEFFADIPPDSSKVTSFSNSGRHASGTASFVDLTGYFSGPPPAPVQGTFEISCSS